MSDANFCLRCGQALQLLPYQDGHTHPVCPDCGWAFFPDPKVAVAVLVEKQGKVLLVRRVYDPMQGHWTLPAGFLNAGEDPAAAAERECLEETGLQVKTRGIIEIITGRDHPRGADLVLVYQAEITGGMLRAADDAAEVDFFARDHLPPLAFRASKKVLGVIEEEKW